MVGSRTVTVLVGLAVSIAVSVIAWVYFDTLLVFLIVPFVPFLLPGRSDRPPERRCPVCGFSTRNPEFEHCPRDGTALTVSDV